MHYKLKLQSATEIAYMLQSFTAEDAFEILWFCYLREFIYFCLQNIISKLDHSEDKASWSNKGVTWVSIG